MSLVPGLDPFRKDMMCVALTPVLLSGGQAASDAPDPSSTTSGDVLLPRNRYTSTVELALAAAPELLVHLTWMMAACARTLELSIIVDCRPEPVARSEQSSGGSGEARRRSRW